jgi:RimJ/RimL family protein N-acetyltransferase
MNRSFHLKSSEYPEITLRTIAESDLECLRNWKNKNRQYFFFQGMISPADQMRWFEGYLTREHDNMFMVVNDTLDIGCMGIRLLDRECDIYNVILGRPEMGGRRLMTRAFHLMCSYAAAEYKTRLTAKVLLTNPSINWYQQNGFRVVGKHSDHLKIERDQTAYPPCSVVAFHNSTTQP